MKFFSRAFLGATLFCSLAWAQDAPDSAANQAVNGDMETGDVAPANWKKDWIGKGEITLARDTQTVHSGQAAMRVDATETQALVVQFVEAKAGDTFKVGGFVKTAGQIKLSFDVSPRDKDWKKVGDSFQIGYLQGDAKEWLPIEKTVTMPEGTARFAVAIYVEGTGSAWVDDVKVEAATVKTAK